HTTWPRDWSSDVCSSDLAGFETAPFTDGPLVRAVDIELVRAEFYKQYPAEGDAKQKAETRRKQFNRAVLDAKDKKLAQTREVERSEERRVGKERRAERWT